MVVNLDICRELALTCPTEIWHRLSASMCMRHRSCIYCTRCMITQLSSGCVYLVYPYICLYVRVSYQAHCSSACSYKTFYGCLYGCRAAVIEMRRKKKWYNT